MVGNLILYRAILERPKEGSTLYIYPARKYSLLKHKFSILLYYDIISNVQRHTALLELFDIILVSEKLI